MDKDGNECEEWMNARSFDINVVYHWYVGHSWADQNFFTTSSIWWQLLQLSNHGKIGWVPNINIVQGNNRSTLFVNLNSEYYPNIKMIWWRHSQSWVVQTFTEHLAFLKRAADNIFLWIYSKMQRVLQCCCWHGLLLDDTSKSLCYIFLFSGCWNIV